MRHAVPSSMLIIRTPLFTVDVLKKCALIAVHSRKKEEAEKMDVMLRVREKGSGVPREPNVGE